MTSLKLVILGANGQVGYELQRSLLPLGEVIALDRSHADLTQLDNLKQTLIDLKPDVIVNAAAYTAVDKAEEEQDLAMLINGEAPGVIAETAKQLDALLIHYSTDYVFDGTKSEPYTEDDIPNPINVYGKTKLAGEIAIQKTGCDYFIFRTSWVYATRGTNFAKTIMKLASEREELKVIADQFGAPTSAELIADITALILDRVTRNSTLRTQISGTYHLAADGETSWYVYAQFVLEKAIINGYKLRVLPSEIVPVSTADYVVTAKRPLNSCLDTNKLQSCFEVVLPVWQQHMKHVVLEILGNR